MRPSSLMDKFILRSAEPDEVIEDSVHSANKPFDRYSKFKKTCKREKIRVDNLVHDLNKANSVNEELIRIHINSIKKLKRTYKQDISIFDDTAAKQNHNENNNDDSI